MKDNKKYKLLAVSICIILFCIGCSNNKRNEDITIENKCENLTSEKANAIANEIREVMLKTWKEVNRIENFLFIYSNEKQEDGKTIIDITVEADWTTFRKPEENPIIIGMNEVVEELKTQEEKEKAKTIISGFTSEMSTNYNETERLPTNLKVKYKIKDYIDYELFYPEVKDGITTLYPMEEYFDKNYKENAEERKKLGRETLLEELMN